uniref:Uncharacterized protein n=1 Tax=Candidatus Kentrum sp. FM TaxID=2126340 RepID=A0A450SU29_9GAMM|nr:MAG: hypothetical protein BECKFM1743A_GA0114220_101896 [Candidatus Kentron sp. FM]
MHAFHAAISIRYWFAIDIAIRYRYRSCPAFPIASSDIDSDPERTTITCCGSAALDYYPAISCFLRTFFQARRTQREGEAPAEPLENRSNPLRLRRGPAPPERPRFAIWLRFPALCNYPSEIDGWANVGGRRTGGEHLGSPLRSPERRGESCIRPLCPKVAALPRYVIGISPINPESDKSQV